MSEWKRVSLGQLGSFRNGLNFSQKDYGSGFPIINVKQLYGGRFAQTNNLTEVKKTTVRNLDNLTLKYGDILFARSSVKVSGAGQVAMVNITPENCVFSGFIIRFRIEASDQTYPLFINYLLRSPEYREFLTRIGSGTTITNLSQETLSNIEINLPPLPEQKAIASILSSLDDKIELNRRMNETLEAMARAIFKDWFVDFGPTRAKQEGRAAYLPEQLWSLFPEAIDPETGLPIGWELATLGSIAESVNRTVNPTEIDEKTPYIGLEHIPRHSIALPDWEGAGKVTSNKLRFETGEFLFGKLRPYFHKVGIAPLSGICSTDIVVVRARSEIWSSFVLIAISTNNFVEYTNLTSTGTKMPRTSWSIMAKYEFPLPAEHLVKQFDLIVKPCTSQIISNIHQGRTLAELRDRLLPKLMSGEIRVKEAEKMVEEVT